jgi:hypothetical protein
MADKYHSDNQSKVDLIDYEPGVQDTADLESGTHTIVPTSRPAIGSAQYSKALTLAKPADNRLVVKRIASRLSVNIAGLGTATHVYCSVRVDVDDSDHELFSEDWTSTGAKLATAETHSGALSAIFDLLKDGAAHTFYFLFWADAANQATIDVVQLWEAVGNGDTGSVPNVVSLSHDGFCDLTAKQNKVGSGGLQLDVCQGGVSWGKDSWRSTATKERILVLIKGADFYLWPSVATDIIYIDAIVAALRSER